MRVALVTVGSLGDVEPVLALALGLRRAGHEVRVVGHASFAALARGIGIDLRPTEAADPRGLAESDQGREAFVLRNPFRAWRAFASLAEASARMLFADVLAASDGVDAVGYSGLGVFPGYAVAERLGVPYFAAHLVPIGPTGDFPSAFFPQGPAWLPGYNRTSHALASWVVWRSFAPLADRARAEWRPSSHFPSPEALATGARVSLVGVSPAVVPPPVAWTRWARFTGYWFLEARAAWIPPSNLVRFLERGPPPVVVGFGSMSGRDPAGTTRIVLEALALAGVRGVLLCGWGGLQPRELPTDVLALDSVPHAWLYPRAAAVVHHGGAGTTASALRAGVPSVAVPFAFDQPFWAERLRRLGAGPAPVPERGLTPARLARAIRRAVQDPRMRLAARAVGERIRAEDGVGIAVRELERALGWHGPT
jgi:UDP:flavonoid glycosyltransferase YjiC (YdhE family)